MNNYKGIFGVRINENNVCVASGEVPLNHSIVPEDLLFVNARSMQYGMIFARDYEQIVHISKTRDYNKRTFVSYKDRTLLIGAKSKPNWYLLRPDTIVDIVPYLLQSINDHGDHVFTGVYGDTIIASEEGLFTALCYYWNYNL